MKRITMKKFAVLGRAGMDLYATPTGVSLNEAEGFITCLGGSAANIAVAITRQGGVASLITSVADNAIGRYCLKELEKYSVDTSHIKVVAGTNNSIALADSRTQDHQCVLYRDGAADFQVTNENVSEVNFSKYSALIATGTIFAAEPSRSSSILALELAKKAGLVIIFDIDYRPYSWTSMQDAAETYISVAQLSDIIIGNDIEFDCMAGESGKGIERARELVKQSPRLIIYKMGEYGSITITPDEEFQTGIYKIKTLKPIGAGDGFMGGFVTALANKWNLRECVKRGSASAAIVVSRVGCAPAMPTAQELDDFLDSHTSPDNI